MESLEKIADHTPWPAVEVASAENIEYTDSAVAASTPSETRVSIVATPVRNVRTAVR